VDPVRKVEIRISGNTLEHERHQSYSKLIGQARIDRLESPDVVRSEIGWQLETQQERCCSHLEGFEENLPQVLLGHLNRQAAKPIVAAQTDNQNVWRLAKNPFESAESTGRRVPADAGIDDLGVDAFLGKPAADDGWKSLFFTKPEASRETVSQEDDSRHP
jgi:hypothetical protein